MLWLLGLFLPFFWGFVAVAVVAVRFQDIIHCRQIPSFLAASIFRVNTLFFTPAIVHVSSGIALCNHVNEGRPPPRPGGGGVFLSKMSLC